MTFDCQKTREIECYFRNPVIRRITPYKALSRIIEQLVYSFSVLHLKLLTQTNSTFSKTCCPPLKWVSGAIYENFVPCNKTLVDLTDSSEIR